MPIYIYKKESVIDYIIGKGKANIYNIMNSENCDDIDFEIN